MFLETFNKIMYYVAFFVDYRPFLREKLSLFLDNSFSEVWLCQPQQERQFQSLDELPSHSGYWYPHSWYLHGLPIKNADKQHFPTLPIYTEPNYKISLEQINAALDWLATHYSWSLFPWGGPGRFLSFAFLSSDRLLVKQFISLSSNVQQIVNPFNISNSYNLLISQYEIQEKFSWQVQGILFSGYHQPAARIWDSCQCNSRNPWLITDQFDEDIFSIFDWGEVDYEFLESLSAIDNNSPSLGIYQPKDRQSFQSMCRLSSQNPSTLVCVSQDTDVERLYNLLLKIENSNSYSDLCYFQEILTMIHWFYGLDRDRVDYGNSLFVSQDKKLIREINKFTNKEDDNRLIVCF